MKYIKENSALKKAVKSIFSKKGIAVAGTAGIISYGAVKISDF